MNIIIIIIALIGLATITKFIPSLILLTKFAYPNAKFSAIEITYLKEKELLKLLELKNLMQLKENVVSKDFIIKGETINEMQKSIDDSLAKIILMAKKDSPKKVRKFYDVYLEKIDADMLKKAIMNAIKEREIKEYAYSDEISNIINKLKKAEKEEIEKILREHGFHILLDMSLNEIEREIDRRIIEKIIATPLPKSCNKAKEKFAKILIDIINLKTIFRGKHYNFEDIEKCILKNGWEISEWQIKEFLKIDAIPEIISLLEGTSYFPELRQAIAEFEEEGVIALEKALDRHLIKAVRQIANEYPLTIGPGIRFIVEKEYEARNLKIIIKAIGEGLQEEAKKLLVMQ